ncbi:hypothetical protein, partial [Mycetocola zhadangensis]
HAVEFSRIGCSRFSPLRAAPQGNFSTLAPVIRQPDHAILNRSSKLVSSWTLMKGHLQTLTNLKSGAFCLKKFVPHEAGELSSAAPLG